MPEATVPFRTAPVTASDGIHETLVTDDSTRMSASSDHCHCPCRAGSRARVGRERRSGEGGAHPVGRGSAPPHPGTAHLVGTHPTIWNGGSWGTGGSPCSSPTTT